MLYNPLGTDVGDFPKHIYAASTRALCNILNRILFASITTTPTPTATSINEIIYAQLTAIRFFGISLKIPLGEENAAMN